MWDLIVLLYYCIVLYCILLYTLHRTGSYLVSGHQTGAVSVWDVKEAAQEDSGGVGGSGHASSDLSSNAHQVAASVSFLAHQDCVNSIR